MAKNSAETLTSGESCFFIEPMPESEIDNFIRHNAERSHYGIFYTELSQSDIDKLKAGKWLLIAQGEYSTVISIEGATGNG